MLRSSRNFKKIGEFMLGVQHADHLLQSDLQRGARGDGRGRGKARSNWGRERFLTNKGARGD
jgi:hypothetical protein